MERGSLKYCAVGVGFALGVGIGLWAGNAAHWAEMLGSSFVYGVKCGMDKNWFHEEESQPENTDGKIDREEAQENTDDDAKEAYAVKDAYVRVDEAEEAFRHIRDYNVETAYKAVPNAAPLGSDGT